MTSRLLFLTARQVFETFPVASADVGAEATDEAPLDYLRRLSADGDPDAGIAFASYLLPRREAVWWACQILRGLGAVGSDADAGALSAAEGWVREPEEENRRAAMNLGAKLDPARAATWLAFAAGWSGGSLVAPDYDIVPPPPHLTAKAVRAAVVLALAGVPPPDRARLAGACVDSALRFASGGDARL